MPRKHAVSGLAAAVLCAVWSVLGCPPAVAQTSAPGAMKSDGSFFVLKTSPPYHQVWEHTSTGWVQYHDLVADVHFTSNSDAPRGLTSTGGFHMVGKGTDGKFRVAHWEPAGGGVTYELTPPGLYDALSPTSEVMYGNRVYMAGHSAVNGEGRLVERPTNPASAWGILASSRPSDAYLSPVRPATSVDGKLYTVSTNGKVYQMWWDGGSSSWQWYNHGVPQKGKVLRWWWQPKQPEVRAVLVGGCTMPGYKVFVTCDDATLREIYYNGAWQWANHGKPGLYNVDSEPASIRDGSVWVACKNGSSRALFESHWTGSQWVWYSYGAPSGISIVGAPLTYPNLDEVVVKGADGNFYMLTPGTGVWQNLGHP